MKILVPAMVAIASVLAAPGALAADRSYPIVDTGQVTCYDERVEIRSPKPGCPFAGQDAQYPGNQPSYRSNRDGTVADRITGLMWQADPGTKKTHAEAVAGADTCRTGGYDDWRLPTIKELYSLILFSGTDPDPRSRDTSRQRPFIDSSFFEFSYGSAEDGDRIIDAQYATSTRYVSTTMNGNPTMFGVNFADGRIKGYPMGRDPRGRMKTFYVLYVRGNPEYGKNTFVDRGDGTVTDQATGLTWMKVDSAGLKAGPRGDGTLDWEEALEWAENLVFAGHTDWRLPNAKELQSIVDYTRSPDTTDSAAIDPVFDASPIANEAGKQDYAHYWTGTSHVRSRSAASAVYVAFGRALGFMPDRRSGGRSRILMDVHGAGAQRSDAKSGDPGAFPTGRGPQGDVVRIHNLVRCVRGGTSGP